MSQQIQAVIFDIDGTAMLNERDAMPSDRLAMAIQRAQTAGIRLSCATGRNYAIAKHITQKLGLIDPSIFAGGTQILQPTSGEELWAGYMSMESVRDSLAILAPYNLKVVTDGDTYETATTAGNITPKPLRMLDVQHIKTVDLQTIMEQVQALNTVAAIPVDSQDPELVFLHITDVLATKEHAVHELLQLLNLDPAVVAGVGDGLNDKELFKGVGLKLAMGNARNELKAVANRILDPVENDGLAQYIEELVA